MGVAHRMPARPECRGDLNLGSRTVGAFAPQLSSVWANEAEQRGSGAARAHARPRLHTRRAVEKADSSSRARAAPASRACRGRSREEVHHRRSLLGCHAAAAHTRAGARGRRLRRHARARDGHECGLRLATQARGDPSSQLHPAAVREHVPKGLQPAAPAAVRPAVPATSPDDGDPHARPHMPVPAPAGLGMH